VEIFAELLALLLMTRALGEAAERLGQPASVGELSAGILLALAAAKFGQDLPFLDRLASSEALEYAANLGIFFLVLLAGVELDPREIRENSAGAFVVALGGMALPLLGGLGLAWIFLPESELKQGQVLLVGVALSISAIPATVKVFTDLGLLHARVGQTVISAAVFDDVLGLFLLAVLLALLQTGQVPDVATLGLLLAKVAGFFVVTIALGAHVYPRVRRGLKLMQAAAMEFSALVAVALAYGFLAELLGLHWILGAFMAGLYFAPSRVGPAAYTEMKAILTALTAGILGPLFFTSIGLHVDLRTVTAVPLFLSLLIAVAFLGKIVGAGLPALWSGMGRRQALAVGVGMSARGAVELVVISIAYQAGLFAPPGIGHSLVTHLFSSLILMAVVTTLLTPIVLRRILPKSKR
jgi:Kef-type K+ transport system membrane component KefB